MLSRSWSTFPGTSLCFIAHPCYYRIDYYSQYFSFFYKKVLKILITWILLAFASLVLRFFYLTDKEMERLSGYELN